MIPIDSALAFSLGNQVLHRTYLLLLVNPDEITVIEACYLSQLGLLSGLWKKCVDETASSWTLRLRTCSFNIRHICSLLSHYCLSQINNVYPTSWDGKWNRSTYGTSSIQVEWNGQRKCELVDGWSHSHQYISQYSWIPASRELVYITFSWIKGVDQIREYDSY